MTVIMVARHFRPSCMVLIPTWAKLHWKLWMSWLLNARGCCIRQETVHPLKLVWICAHISIHAIIMITQLIELPMGFLEYYYVNVRVYFLSVTVWMGIIFFMFVIFWTKFSGHKTSLSRFGVSNKYTSDLLFSLVCLRQSVKHFSLWKSSRYHQNMHILIIVPKEKSF